ncbi:MAG: DUF421 domain-containing protein [Chitinophagaceae bacterium]|nr:MAG: DUF421 domain-containing protein [Chitinophagaceae bacterium]
MVFLQSNTFSWKELLLGDQEWQFLPEVMIRTLIMFTIVLLSLSLLGKRGVRQLSVFELVVIIGLGSAAGDPMFYKDVGLVPAVIVFGIVIGLYSLVTHLVGKNKTIGHLVEGKPICLVRDGRFAISNFSKENLGQDEFFAELRLKGVSHLGQVENAIIETNGQISIFYYEDEKVRYGLPVMPGSLELQSEQITDKGHYACTFCGQPEEIPPVSKYSCPVCHKTRWVPARKDCRIT